MVGGMVQWMVEWMECFNQDYQNQLVLNEILRCVWVPRSDISLLASDPTKNEYLFVF